MNEQSLVARVNRLERENRRMKLVGILVLLGVAAVMVMGQAGSGKQRIVTAEKFVLQDEGGKERGLLFANPDGIAGLMLSDSKGNPRFMAAVKPDGDTSLNIFGDRKNRMALGANGIAFKIQDEDRAFITLQDNGDPLLKYTDKYGKRRLFLMLNKGAPLMGIMDDYGKVIWSAP